MVVALYPNDFPIPSCIVEELDYYPLPVTGAAAGTIGSGRLINNLLRSLHYNHTFDADYTPLLCGGYNTDDGGLESVCHFYDYGRDSWIQMGNVPYAASFPQAAAYSPDWGLVIAGGLGIGGEPQRYSKVNRLKRH